MIKSRASLLLISLFVAINTVPMFSKVARAEEKQAPANKAKSAGGVYEFSAKSLSGEDIKLDKYKGKLLLIVNTASKCGFTPQYGELEKLHEKYGDKGLAVLGFPCNQFGSQEPGNDSEIAGFCQKNYGVKFQMFSKIDVNGATEHPLYKYLKSEASGLAGSKDIKWNFTKFLVGKDGKVLKRYAPTVTPLSISADIDKELGKS